MPLFPVDSLEDPRLAAYRDLKTTNLTRQSGRFIAEGRRVVLRLLESDFDLESLLVSDRRLDEFQPRVPAGAPTYVVPHDLAVRLVGYNFHSGVLACGRRKPPPDLARVVSRASGRLTLAACPSVTDPDNVGAIVRLGAAFGIDALLLGKGCPDPFSRRVLRISMGTAFRLPIRECRDLAGDVRWLRDECGVQLAATVLEPDAERLRSAPRPPRLALLFGHEAHGLEREWLDLCSRRLTIPMPRAGDSLNVAVAAGIVLYHFQEACEVNDSA